MPWSTRWGKATSAHRARKARAAWLRGANAVTGARSTDMRSMRDKAGIGVAATPAPFG